MEIKTGVSLQTKQTLSQVQMESLTVLSMSMTELREFLQDEEIENPLVEYSSGGGGSQIPVTYRETERFYGSRSLEDADQPDLYQAENGPESVENLVMMQLSWEKMGEDDRKVVDFCINSLEQSGYLPIPPEEIAKRNAGCDMKRYAEYMRNQVTELLTGYGKVDIIWFDFSYPDNGGKGRDDWESEKLFELVHRLQPGIVVDNRLDLPGSGDIVTPEQYMPDRGLVDENGKPVVWEGCQTFSGSWGYHRDEASWKSPRMCIEMLINHVSRGGNLLMNVGPTSRGYLDRRAMDRLGAYAEWMKYNSRSIYGCGLAPEEFPAPTDCRYTYNPETNRLYLHCFAWPFRHVNLEGLGGKLRYAQLLADGSEIRFHVGAGDHMNSGTPENGVTLELPVVLPEQGTAVPVIELFLK